MNILKRLNFLRKRGSFFIFKNRKNPIESSIHRVQPLMTATTISKEKKRKREKASYIAAPPFTIRYQQ